jgi:hypothetical protein
MNIFHEPQPNDDLDIAGLLQQTGGRNVPPAHLHDAVWAIVHADWRDMVRERTRRQRRILGRSLAAGVGAVTCGALLAFNAMYSPAMPVATIVRIDGRLIASSSDGPMPSIAVGEAIVAGEALRTDAHSRAALRWPAGLSLRMDHDTTIKVASPSKIALISGALYVDGSDSEALSIESALGTVRHLGTQYMVLAQPDALEISIREGRVSIDGRASSLVGSAGERIRMRATGAVERTTLTSTDTSWNWAIASAPAFQIDNQSLVAFLEWFSRQTGRPVVFESPQAKSAAARVILRGSIEGLDLDTALSAVLSTTQLHRYPTANESIGIALNRP